VALLWLLLPVMDRPGVLGTNAQLAVVAAVAATITPGSLRGVVLPTMGRSRCSL
jgi:hypothetical protein